jgi:diacylglycerol kinase family enzyme
VIRSLRERHVERFTGRRIQVRASRTVRRQLDGDSVSDGTSLVAEADASALVVRVP